MWISDRDIFSISGFFFEFNFIMIIFSANIS